ncbi:MAG: Lrp/AsnC family transcriptional regulator [Oscillatoriophycideae cyanobacterium NC_groundwater_1537_Pr4_S-0.65um_50_18]|nr:Lrp/AsnC family transcriptional regulator [Oscillatoriophycideae cyanobacterium NC_groundwater_1537_Pr4_S-0.65um_50_18]
MAQENESPSIVLDNLDQEIIGLLKLDGRIAFTEIAKRLNIPEATARYRVQRLLQSGAIQIHAWLNPEKLGTPHVVIVRLIAENTRIEPIAEALARMVEVQFVSITTGQYNIVADVYFGTHDELLALFAKIQQIPGIISYDSQVVLKLLKAEYQYRFSEGLAQPE